MEATTEDHTNQNTQRESPVPVVIFVKHSCTQGWGNIVENGAKRWQEPEDKGVFCERVSPTNVRSCSLKVSPMCLSKRERNKDDIREDAKQDGAKASTLHKDL